MDLSVKAVIMDMIWSYGLWMSQWTRSKFLLLELLFDALFSSLAVQIFLLHRHTIYGYARIYNMFYSAGLVVYLWSFLGTPTNEGETLLYSLMRYERSNFIRFAYISFSFLQKHFSNGIWNSLDLDFLIKKYYIAKLCCEQLPPKVSMLDDCN